MEKVYSRIEWENEPSINTPINATNLNKVDYAVNELDDRVILLDTTKANQSDLLLSVKEISFDKASGVFIFTWQNGTTLEVDLNVEKIPVSFSMSETGIITMKNEDGTEYTCNVAALIKAYLFNSSNQIAFTVSINDSGNYEVTATIVNGSITKAMLDPTILSTIEGYSTNASKSAANASDSATEAASYARGGTTTREGEDEDNARYYAEQAKNAAEEITEKLDKFTITNNLLATEPGTSLDAAQGKVLDDKITGISDKMGGFAFYTNPTVVYLLADNSTYTDSNGNYVLADSETGAGLLADAETYYSDVVEGDYRSVGGADSVTPFRSGSGESVSGGVEIYYLGEGTEFDISTLLPNVDYTKLTENNFIIGIKEIAKGSTKPMSNVNYKSYAFLESVTPSKAYDASTGILSILDYKTTLYQKGSTSSSSNSFVTKASVNISPICHAYLVIGEIKTV